MHLCGYLVSLCARCFTLGMFHNVLSASNPVVGLTFVAKKVELLCHSPRRGPGLGILAAARLNLVGPCRHLY